MNTETQPQTAAPACRLPAPVGDILHIVNIMRKTIVWYIHTRVMGVKAPAWTEPR